MLWESGFLAVIDNKKSVWLSIFFIVFIVPVTFVSNLNGPRWNCTRSRRSWKIDQFQISKLADISQTCSRSAYPPTRAVCECLPFFPRTRYRRDTMVARPNLWRYTLLTKGDLKETQPIWPHRGRAPNGTTNTTRSVGKTSFAILLPTAAHILSFRPPSTRT